jgi:hypothetical protein
VADERTCPRTRDVDRHEQDIREIREKYVLRELFITLVERVKDLEDEATSIRRGNRVAILGGIGAIVTAVILQFITKGSAH